MVTYLCAFPWSLETAFRTLNNGLADKSQMKCLVIYERSSTGWNAFSPDLPGLQASAMTLRTARKEIRDTMELHRKGAHRDGFQVAVIRDAGGYAKIDVYA
jgi:predicted RNase H-like HicB family nuclease